MSEITKPSHDNLELTHDDFVPTDPNHMEFGSRYANEAGRDQLNQLSSLLDTLAQRGSERQLSEEHVLHEKKGKTEMPGLDNEEAIDYRVISVLGKDGVTSETQIKLGSEDEDQLRVIFERVNATDYKGYIAGSIASKNVPLDKETARFLEAVAQGALIETNLPESETQE